MVRFIVLLIGMCWFMLPAAQPTGTATQWVTMSAYAPYAHQLRLIDSLRQFCTDELKLNIGDSFYTTWKESSDSMFVYLYVSRADTIALPDMVSTMIWAFEREDSAITKSNELRMQGYHTLVYKTAGTSGAFLNHKLLSYPDEAIAFIVFHEAVHRHVGMMIDYNYIEALCDAVANRAILQFAAKTGRLSIPKAVVQKEIIEEAYRFLNSKRDVLDRTGPTRQQKVFNDCNLKIEWLLKEANQFITDRMNYPVTNAYFIRVQPYAIHYFEMYDGLGESIDISAATTGLPGAEQLKPQNEIKLLPDKGNPVYDWDR